ncbi:histone-lysine N-methyltransferase ASHH3-like isoform X2 [Amaranthus tricolor]|uniref:histone-lysine N-methyltransferase ASHH3-like isoform X2 n=1 Tax=Amaranthus tricolor TaxID=29722 RepID=UPI00258BE1AD|nr:histone-lysine N-methyltransferase ASHH3-like isoform X2 [Amaranthus tricolor]
MRLTSAERNGVGNVFNKLIKQLGNPVEFRLPDWINKRQTAPYVFIKRISQDSSRALYKSLMHCLDNNLRGKGMKDIYVTKKLKRRHEDDGIFCSCNQSPGSNTSCGRDCHCGMLLSSCSSNCKCGTGCVNKPFQQRPVKKMKLVQTEKCGSGIVADEDIKRGEFVIEYVGEVIDDKTCEERLWKMKHSGETNFYLCEVNRDMVIDATEKGNKSRYINHSCCPNTEMQKWSVDGETRIGIFATRDIKKGEHLTYDYQFVQFGADQDCHCGASGCRRKLGVKPNKKMPSSDAALKLVARQVYQNGGSYGGNSRDCIGEVVRLFRYDNRRSFGIIKRFDNITKKHLIMFEDGCAEFIDMSKEDWEFCSFFL